MTSEDQTAYKHESADELLNQYFKERNMSDNKFWATVWVCIVTAFSVLVGGVTYVNRTDTIAVEELIKAGTDPFSARCAVSPDRQGVCIAYAIAQSNK